MSLAEQIAREHAPQGGSMSMKIWIDHLEDITRIARAYQDFLTTLGQEPENGSDLFYRVPEVTIMCGDEPTGWSLIVEDDAVYLRVEETR